MQKETLASQIWKYLENEDALLRVVFSGIKTNDNNNWIKVTLRPVMIKGEKLIQFSYYDKRKCIVKNYTDKEYNKQAKELLELPFKSALIESMKGNIKILTNKKGEISIHEDKKLNRQDINLDHNISKKYILPENTPSIFLEAVGIMTKDGRVKSHKQNKFKQLNGFLKIIDETFGKAQKNLNFNNELLAIDCGCGNAYLTFATYNYFNNINRKPLELIGIDINKDLLEGHKDEIKKLNWKKLSFEATKIIEYNPPRSPDLVLSLHACDTATDDALFKAINWDSKMVFASPCCHHNLQVQLDDKKELLNEYAPILRHGALSERLGDLLTDAFRVLILRIMGYQTDIIEFVASENTNRNLIIRAIKYLEPGDKKFVNEYKTLKKNWQVTPYLEKLLGEKFQKYLIIE